MLDAPNWAQPPACAYIRLLLPLTAAPIAARFSVRFVQPNEVEATTADVVVVQRLAFKSAQEVLKLLDLRARRGFRLIYEIDDDILALDEGHNEHGHYARLRPVVLGLVGAADEIWVSTTELARRLAGLNANVVVLQNELDRRFWKAPKNIAASPVLRMVYMGTSTHQEDFNSLLRPAFAQLRRELGATVELTLIGVSAEACPDDGVRTLVPPEQIAASYPAFAAWLQNQGPFDLGLAPLLDNPFNHAKSYIKWLEYAAIGAATIASRVGEYPERIDHGQDGVLCAPGADGFYQALRRLALDRDCVATLRKNARAMVAEHLVSGGAANAQLARLQKWTANCD